MKKFLFSFILIAGLLTLSGCGQKEDENALVILNYGKYIEPDVIQQFEKETGITIKYEEYESPEEMYTKYKAGSIKYDLICTSDYMIQKLINEGEVLEMDYDNIPLYENIDPTYVEFSKAFDPETKYTLPYFCLLYTSSPPAVKGYFKYGIHAPERPSLRVAYHRI